VNDSEPVAKVPRLKRTGDGPCRFTAAGHIGPRQTESSFETVCREIQTETVPMVLSPGKPETTLPFVSGGLFRGIAVSRKSFVR
jgi:hypothetical protein